MKKRENYKILILEDDASFLVGIEMMLEKMGFNEPTVVKSAEKALVYLKENQPDLILVDIYLDGELTGIDFAELIKSKDIPMIFLTFYHNDSTFEKARIVQPVAFLGKAIDKLTLQSTIELAFDKWKGSDLTKETNLDGEVRFTADDIIFIRSNTSLEKVKISEITYINSDGNYCWIHMGQKKLIIKNSLVSLEKKMPKDLFFKVHRRYLVQPTAISKIETKANVLYIGEEQLPIGRNYKKELFEQLNLLS